MSLRTAIRHSGLLTFALLLAGIWVVLTALQVVGAVGSARDTGIELFGAGHAVGQTLGTGLMGLVVLAVLLVCLLFLFGELIEGDPLPDTFPPER